MSRYIGMLMLVLGALLLVNFASDVLYARAVAAQIDEEDEPPVVAVAVRDHLPLTGLIRAPTGRWGQGRVLEASAKPMTQTAESCTSPVTSMQR